MSSRMAPASIPFVKLMTPSVRRISPATCQKALDTAIHIFALELVVEIEEGLCTLCPELLSDLKAH